MARLGACIVVALGLVATAAQAEPRDLIANGGFERGLDGWSFDGQWVRDETVARTGKACVTGRLQRADGVRALLQSVSLRQDAVYELRFWARSSSSNKLSVWIRHEGRRDLVTQMLRVPRDWTLQTYTFEVRFTGEAGLELNLPTTFDGPPGQAWVDDVELIEHVVPPSVPVSDGLARSDSPFVASDDAGRLYYAWIESARSRDWLWVAGGRPSAAGLELDVRQMLDVNATSVESVSLAGADRGAWGAVSVETPLGWDILAFRLNTQGIAATRFVTRDAAVDIRPVVAWDGERGWVAWESNRDGRRQIWASVLPPDDATPPVRLSDGSDSAYFPAIAGNRSGRVAVAWEQFVGGQYDIFLTELGDGGFAPSRPLTANPYLEHRPTLAHAPDGLWAAWEVSEYPSYRTTYATWRRVVAARIDPDGLKSTPDFWDAFADWHSSPRLLASSTGTLHLSTRRSRGRTGSWDVALSELTDAGWRPATIVTRLQGRDRAAPLAEAAGRIWVAVQEDNLQGAWNTAEEGRNFRSEVRLAAAPEQAGEAGAGMVRVVWPDTAFDSAVLRERFGEDRARYVTEQDGRKLNLYWGQFHEHSDISVDARQIDLSPDDNYTHNRDIHRMDFSALTDHDFNMSAHIWSYMGKLARWQEDPGKFVTFLAMEWTSSFLESTHAHPHGYYGHRNLILQDTRYPRWFLAREGETPADVWRVLRADGAEFIHIPHQLADERVPMDWDWVDEEAQPLAEIFQHRGSYEGEGVPRQANGIPGHYLQDAWADGVIIGVIASPDHGGGRGKAAVYAPELTRASLLDACRSRHTYGTTGAKIVLDVRVDGHLMGDKVALREGPVAIEVFASGTRTLAGIDILKNNQVIHSRNIGTRDTRFTFTDTGALSSGTYYYVRVRQAGGELAWSSPVWFLDEARLGDIQHREGFVEPGSTEGE